MGVYVVDSNFFIQAHRLNYPLDIAQSFWVKIKNLAETEKIISIDKVKKEIFDHQDELKHWCEINLPKNFFKETQGVISSYRQIATWANSKASHYNRNALAEFLDADEADAWLVAFALSDKDNRTIVTHEKVNQKSKEKLRFQKPVHPSTLNLWIRLKC